MNKVIARRLCYIIATIAIVAAIIALVALGAIVAHRHAKKSAVARAVTVTVIPGSTINTIAKTLSRSGLPAQDFLKLALPNFDASTTSRASASTTGSGLEGYLYPDTYSFAANESAADITKTMRDNFDAHASSSLFANQIEHQKETIRSERDVVIIASILEKEVVADADKKIVAGILWKRIDAGLPLQVDSVESYFLASSEGTVYNTYRNTGLPFSPICNPSLRSIEAALEPTTTDYWYFLSKSDGEIVYSRTLSGHLINKAKFVK